MPSNILIAFLMTLIAGLSTIIGSIIAITVKKDNTKFLSISLGFSAGVMIYISLVEILHQAQIMLINIHGPKLGGIISLLSFFFGMVLIGLIDRVIPNENNPHEFNYTLNNKPKSQLYKTGVFTALAVAIHNFPEGLATFVTALSNPTLAIPIVFAIAIHNIPEGIAVAVPIYHSTNSKKKAFIYSLLSGLSEPVGAIIGYMVLMPFLNETIMGILFAMVSGIMVYISFDQLLPAAKEYGNHHLSLYGLIGGMFVMAFSLIIFI